MRINFYVVLCFAGITGFASCSEIFEEPIDDETVALLSPGDGYVGSTSKVFH